jgi:hypothetical protein
VSAGGHHRRAHEQGWELVHVAIDGATRLTYVEVLTDEKALTAIGLLRRAVEHFSSRNRAGSCRRLADQLAGARERRFTYLYCGALNAMVDEPGRWCWS